ncbi:MAG: TOBE domain-containing protein [Proteobacteria bacterium]|nr:TOBE domain-containing protein [Pseudomonadota bacterium]MCL2308325.1 TOBE domain-containing protein [Pseudomonadota bacterium]
MNKPAKLEIHGRFWVERGPHVFLGPGRVDLLEKINLSHSIAEAARQLGMSYKTAWDMINAMNNLADQPLVVRAKGGRQGGGTVLTDYGQHVIADYRAMEQEYETMLAALERRYPHFGQLQALDRRLQLRTSARNQLSAVVHKLHANGQRIIADLDLGAQTFLQAQLTRASVEALDLHPGRHVVALIKAPTMTLSITPVTDKQTLRGTVSHIETDNKGHAEIVLALPSNHHLIVALDHAAECPPLETEAFAVIDPKQVIVAVMD